MIGELGSSPLAHYAQTRLFDAREVQANLREWDRGYCPCCGSWPAFIESLDGTHHLRCSYCAAAWELTRQRCVYCGDSDDRFVAAAPDVAQPERRVELCGACGSYTKVIEASSLTPFPLVAIEDLATMDLDEGAMSRQYSRPDLFDLDTIDPPTTPDCG